MFNGRYQLPKCRQFHSACLDLAVPTNIDSPSRFTIRKEKAGLVEESKDRYDGIPCEYEISGVLVFGCLRICTGRLR